MANKANITLQIDLDLKEQAEALFKALGMDLSTATGVFYRQALQYRGLPFEVRLDEPNEDTYAAELDPFYSNENLARLKKAAQELDAGKGTVHEVKYE